MILARGESGEGGGQGSIDAMGAHLDVDRCRRAVEERDARFDGWFVVCLPSTDTYCRPSCPVVAPTRAEMRFHPSSAAAQRAGCRACPRCRPDAAPGSPEWNHRGDIVGRAMRLIADGVVDRDGVAGLAARLGCAAPLLGRLLRAEVGAGPLALARAQRAQTALLLLESTDLAMAEIAVAAGFGTPRQFNDTVREVCGRAPSVLRAAGRDAARRDAARRDSARQDSAHPDKKTAQPAAASPGAGTVTVLLPYREPLHAGALVDFLAARTIEGVDEVIDGVYRRGLLLPHGPATAEVRVRAGYADATLRLADVRDVAPALARCRRLLDLDADPVAIDARLADDPALAPAVAKEPGVRVPGAMDGFEMAVRAIVGQQISVAGARKILARLVRGCTTPPCPGPPSSADHEFADHEPPVMVDGRKQPPTHDHRDRPGLRGFPTAEAVATAPDEAFGMPAARRRTLRALAETIANGELRLDPGADRAHTQARLLAIHGIGAWTAQYVAARALGDPDVLLPTDLGVRRGAGALGLTDDPAGLAAHAQRHWAPWRSYATIRLWRHA